VGKPPCSGCTRSAPAGLPAGLPATLEGAQRLAGFFVRKDGIWGIYPLDPSVYLT